jgi:hypothetical protein
MRPLIFLATAASGTALLVWAAGGIEGPRTRLPDPRLERASTPVPRASLPLGGGPTGESGLRLDDIGGPRYAMPEVRVFRDPATGERVEIAHFLPWSFAARAGRALPPDAAPGAAFLFEDVVVRTYREPETLAEARRLRDDARAIDDFVRLELFAPRARADGIAGALGAGERKDAPAADVVILLEGDVRVRDRSLGVLVRAGTVAFDPRAHRAAGTGPFSVEHAAWTLDGEDFVLARGLGAHAGRAATAFRFEVSRRAFLQVNEAVLDDKGRPLWDDPAGFRPARVFAGRATVAHDESDTAAPLKIVLEEGVRALQQGGRRMEAERLALTLEPRGETRRGWSLAHFTAEGSPVTIEVPDMPAGDGPPGAARITTQRLRHEPSALGPPTTVLEGASSVVFEGRMTLAGRGGLGRWLRASAADRIVLAAVPGVARGADGTPLVGRRLELRGAARVEQRGADDAGSDGDGAFEDVLEGDEITLALRPGGNGGADAPVSFAALGHVRMSGTRLEGEAERLVADGLDTPTPRLVIEGTGTRLTLLGFGGSQRLFGPEAGAAEGSASGVPAEPARAWTLDHVEAVGAVRGSTTLGGPSLGLPAWLEAERVDFDRVTDRVALTGAAGAPAGVWVEAATGRRHALVAPRIAFERERARLSADGGVEAEVHLGGAPLAGGLLGARPDAASARALTLTTDGRIEVRLVLDAAGGEPAPDTPQSLEVQAPFEARLEGTGPGALDRLSAQRLALAFALRAAPPKPARAAAGIARPAAPRAAESAREPRATDAPLTRWALASRTLALTLEEGELATFDADGGTTLDGEELHLSAARLRFARRVGLLTVEGGARPVAARLGRAGSESRFTAPTVQIRLGDTGFSWVGATGPLQAVLLQASTEQPGRAERFELDCAGDLRIAPEEITTHGATWIRRTTRAKPEADWADPSEIWADRVRVLGNDLLAAAPGAAVARHVRTVVAEGPRTTLRSGAGDRLVEIWCRRLEVDALADLAVLTGVPGEDVVVRVKGGPDIEIARASFDFRTGAVRDLEAGHAVLRPGR